MKDIELNIRISDVHELTSSHVNRWELMRYSGEKLTVTLTSRFIVHADARQVELRVRALYHYMRGMVTRPLIDCGVAAVVDILPFPVNLAEDALPPRVMAILYSVGIGALRGMIALRAAGTAMSRYPLPLVNISELISNQIYGTPLPRLSVDFTEPVVS